MRVGVVGAGIVGLAIAHALAESGACEVTVLEKEWQAAAHQTGHNSGVGHAGVYYSPGSLKATLCSRGRVLLREYCEQRSLPFDEVGKLVIAANDKEIAPLRAIEGRARANGVPDLSWLDGTQIRDIEPHARGAAALHSPHTAITDFPAIARSLMADIEGHGGQVRFGCEVRGIKQHGKTVAVLAGDQTYTFDRLVLCAGLQSDRVAKLAGGDPDPRIIPFLGMYYKLRSERQDLVQGLIYPVPDPRYPFLGVHLTKTMSGEVLIGPNAVLGLARERYKPGAMDLADLMRTLAWPGFYRLVRRNWLAGVREAYGAASPGAFLRAARRYVPTLDAGDLERASTGIRAQAVGRAGELIDDFAITESGRVVVIRNAPSPAATSSLAIAEYLTPKLLGSEVPI